MSKVAVITMGVKLEGEKGYTRFRYLCEFLAQKGYEVDLITTTFQHWEKKQRNLEAVKRECYPFGIKFIYEPGYRKNVDLRRVRSHRIAAKNLKKLLEKEGDYDLIYAEIPPNDVALSAAKYAKEKGIPFVADVNDLWPEAMRMVLDLPIVSNLLFYPLKRDAEKVYALVSGVIGTSDEYRDRPFLNQPQKVLKETVYVGNDIAQFDREAGENESKIKKNPGEFWVSYAGTIGTSYDIKTMILAAEELQKRNREEIVFKILAEVLKRRTGTSGQRKADYKCRICRLCPLWRNGSISGEVRSSGKFFCTQSTAEYCHKDWRLSGSREAHDQYLYECGISQQSREGWIRNQY